jgi:hypothetical protein
VKVGGACADWDLNPQSPTTRTNALSIRPRELIRINTSKVYFTKMEEKGLNMRIGAHINVLFLLFTTKHRTAVQNSPKRGIAGKRSPRINKRGTTRIRGEAKQRGRLGGQAGWAAGYKAGWEVAWEAGWELG